MAQQSWLPDDAQKTCTACNSKFDLMNRKHHCRACGRIFCGNCSNNKIELPHLGTKGKQRVCDQCLKTETKRAQWKVHCIPALQEGSVLLAIYMFTSETVLLRLSSDTRRIELCDAQRARKVKDSFGLDEVRRVVSGKTTSNLKNLKSSVEGKCCFAIVTKNKTYEFQCETSKTASIWTKSVQIYVDLSKFEDPRELNARAREKYEISKMTQEKRREMERNQQKRNEMRAKWGLNKK